ncbi:hypothetical protein M405DRAFT_832177 [Rhizopogon salebrosus TDB-379]|nr:hypothetical protein M405DRAFT_832177 [Rhizopogon salebrosus TDB-379]
MLTSLARITAVALASTVLAAAIPPGTLTACETAEPHHKGSADALPKNNNDDIFEEIHFAVPPAIPTVEGGHSVFRRSNDTGKPHTDCGTWIQ